MTKVQFQGKVDHTIVCQHGRQQEKFHKKLMGEKGRGVYKFSLAYFIFHLVFTIQSLEFNTWLIHIYRTVSSCSEKEKHGTNENSIILYSLLRSHARVQRLANTLATRWKKPWPEKCKRLNQCGAWRAHACRWE